MFNPMSHGEEKLVKFRDLHYKNKSITDTARPMKQSQLPKAQPEGTENWWEFCPVCSSKLHNQKCRFVCSNPYCNYFMSCSEFDM
jgi:hypothetical protein